MELGTTIGRGINSAGLGAQYDAACKRVLSEKAILARIMKECLEEFRDIDVAEIERKYIEGTPEIGETPVLPDEPAPRVRGTSTEDAAIREGTISYDIRFRAIAPKEGGYIELIINVEAQNDFYPGYPLIKRGIYYCSRMISAQYGVEFPPEQYKGVKKVYSIWICMNPPKHRENTISRYRMTEEQLVGKVSEPRENYDLLTVLMVCLGESERSQGLLRLLDVLLSTSIHPETKKQVLENEFAIPISTSFHQEVSGMCNLSKGVLEKGLREGMEKGMKEGMKQGLEKGMEQGLEKGMEQGLEKGTLQAIKNLMETLSFTLQQAMDALKIPETERAQYEKLLNE